MIRSFSRLTAVVIQCFNWLVNSKGNKRQKNELFLATPMELFLQVPLEMQEQERANSFSPVALPKASINHPSPTGRVGLPEAGNVQTQAKKL